MQSFFDGVGETTVPLSESSYRNEKSLTCQETSRELLRFLCGSRLSYAGTRI